MLKCAKKFGQIILFLGIFNFKFQKLANALKPFVYFFGKLAYTKQNKNLVARLSLSLFKCLLYWTWVYRQNHEIVGQNKAKNVQNIYLTLDISKLPSSRISSLPLKLIWPSLKYQVTLGAGAPAASQAMVASLPSRAVWFWGGLIITGDEAVENKSKLEIILMILRYHFTQLVTTMYWN